MDLIEKEVFFEGGKKFRECRGLLGRVKTRCPFVVPRSSIVWFLTRK